MKKCRYCGADLADDAKACCNCGRAVDQEPTENNGPFFRAPEVIGENETTVEEVTPMQDPAPEASPEQNQGKGYWQYGTWHPLEDLNASAQNNGAQNGGSQWDSQPDRNWWNQAPGQMNAGNPYQRQSMNQNQEYQNPWNDHNTQNMQNQQNPWAGQQNWGNPVQMQRYNGFAVASLIIGALSVFLNGFLFLVPSVLAIAFAIVALLQFRKDGDSFKGKWMAIVGLVLGIVMLIFWLIAFIGTIYLMQDPEFQKQLQEIVSQYMNQ